MVLNFPNESRSFDAAKNRVRFWGYDRAMEISFFIEADALQMLSASKPADEAGYLKTFDAALEVIHTAADNVYRRGPKGSYSFVLSAADF